MRYSQIKSSNTGTLLRRDTAQESEHDRFVHFKERILIADVRIHQQIELVAHEQIDNGEIHIITKNALLHALFEEVHCIFGGPVPIVLLLLISLGIFLDILKKLLVRGMKTLYAPLITSQQNFQYVTGSLYYSFHKNITILLGLQDTFFQQGFLVRKNFVESALLVTQRCGYLIHRDSFYSICC